MVSVLEDLAEATTDVEVGSDDLNEDAVILEEEVRHISSSNGPWSTELLRKAGKLKLIDEDSGLRRSYRKKEQNKGFKGKGCKEKEKFSEPALAKKKKPSSAPREKKKPVTKKKRNMEDDTSPKKKSKK
ncbi:hypothetical protein HU200_062726 [Digitaria exilis]|uniref:Uncharacterized protein n=1 Tax=Digitaria exilis TaxID=1010633 RepID=A0A835A8H6_9POAL|nr:hypothetical protein HU200_062726 [Digitaria exilis]